MRNVNLEARVFQGEFFRELVFFSFFEEIGKKFKKHKKTLDKSCKYLYTVW